MPVYFSAKSASHFVAVFSLPLAMQEADMAKKLAGRKMKPKKIGDWRQGTSEQLSVNSYQ
ncbi:MAG: hypothetical protein WCO56_14680 [Verrucomicrobiota bacterium]